MRTLPRVLWGWLLMLSFASGEELRPLSTDRPDTTESPHTVDAGHFQMEWEIAAWEKDGSARQLTLGELNAKVGLTDSSDLQVILPFYQKARMGGEGFGDMEVRLKQNLWGNDEGRTALGLMPFVRIPTANGSLGNGEWEGGLIVPLGLEGPAGWDFGTMAEVDLEADDDGKGHHLVALVSATASHAITEEVAMFFEGVALRSFEAGAEWEAYFNTGMTWQPVENWQLDGGVRLGLTGASTDVTPFLGISTKH
jgi:hypothetical protein